MRCMFQGCKELKYIDLSYFNTFKVTDMGCMFKDCHKLKEIKGINNFSTYSTINMSDIFSGCNELIYLIILSKFKINNLKMNNNSQEIEILNEENQNLKREINITIAINFMSITQNINFPISCKITDNFNIIEEKLFLEYPELKNKNLNYLSNGNIINRYETLENNSIKNGDAILIDENEPNN